MSAVKPAPCHPWIAVPARLTAQQLANPSVIEAMLDYRAHSCGALHAELTDMQGEVNRLDAVNKLLLNALSALVRCPDYRGIGTHEMGDAALLLRSLGETL